MPEDPTSSLSAWEAGRRIRESRRHGETQGADTRSSYTDMDGEEGPSVSAPRINPPRGGGAIQGLGESFQVNPHTGTAELEIPLPGAAARGFEPNLSLAYGSGAGNGPFGLGFSLSLPYIARRTDRMVPAYTDDDDFFYSGADMLTPRLDSSGRADERQVREDGITWTVGRYLPRTEGGFARIERWTDPAGIAHWRTMSRDGVESIFGRDPEHRVGPDARRILRWLPGEMRDAKGNRIVFEYKRENRENVPDDINESNRVSDVQLYPKRVRWGNFPDESERWAFQLLFDYGEHNPADPLEEVRPWPRRADSFSFYKGGFELREHRLCRNVYLSQRIDRDEERVIRRLSFGYDESPIASLLTSVRAMGYRRDASGEYNIRSLPPLSFGYTGFEPEAGEFMELEAEAVPGIVGEGGYSLVDLDGEGLPGFMYTDDQVLRYWPPEGEGRFSPARIMFRFPREGDLSHPAYCLADIGGDGRLNLVVNEVGRNGFYDRDIRGEWKYWRDFREYPMEDPFAEKRYLDVNGDGLADLMVVTDDSILVYESRGKKGFAAPARGVRERDFPAGNYVWRREVNTFGDMLGDGLEHRVRIRDGSVECRPNLGHGEFGPAFELRNAPRLGHFNAERLFLADIDASGPLDLIYFHDDHFLVFFNESGNAFSDPLRIELPERYDDFDAVHFADIKGNGTACLVLSKKKPRVRHFCYDFTRGVNPRLMNRVENNLGARTIMHYAPSTRFYLEHKKEGRPWATRLPFPVQVVESVETRDLISGTRLKRRFAYRDGYFDPFYREFRGFGMVETWDAEVFDEESEPFQAMPVYTRTWYDVGAFHRPEHERSDIGRGYFEGDANAPETPKSVFQEADLEPGDYYWGYRALGGRVLRMETYGLDGGESEAIPYQVVQHAFTMRRIQSGHGAAPESDVPATNPSVFSVIPRESITLDYERNVADPRVAHEFMLESDEYDNPLLTVSLAYGRRPGNEALPEQSRILATAMAREYHNEIREHYLLGVPAAEKSFELNGLIPASMYFQWDEMREAARKRLERPVAYDEMDAHNHARLLSAADYFYWADDLTRPLPPGRAGRHALLHHVETAFMPVRMAERLYGSEIEDVLGFARERGGYIIRDDYIRDRGGIAYYDPGLFYSMHALEDAFGARMEIEFDEAILFPVSTRDALGNTLRAEMDYDALQARRVIDANDNTAEFRFDPLGLVLVSANYGSENGRRRGDGTLDDFDIASAMNLKREDVLAEPGRILGRAGSVFFNDYNAFFQRGEPPSTIGLTRQVYHDEAESDENSPPLVSISYADGFGRELQNKLRVEAGPAPLVDEQGRLLPDEDGNPVRVPYDERWLSSGRIVYNNKGEPIKQYEPFYWPRAAYASESRVSTTAITVINHYDPLGRIHRVDLPGGYLARTEITGWEVGDFDANDTLRESEYYERNRDAKDPDIADALNKALEHAGTPAVRVMDNLGRLIRLKQYLTPDRVLVSHSRLDIVGNEIAAADPRLVGLGVENFKREFDMSGRMLREDGADDGLRLFFPDAREERAFVRDGNGLRFFYEHDALGRLTATRIAERGVAVDAGKLVRVVAYGEGAEDARERNLRGRVMREYDTAGISEIELYSINGSARVMSRRLTANYRIEPDWSEPAKAELEAEVFRVEDDFDALERAVMEKAADGSVIRRRFNQRGLFSELRVARDDGSELQVVGKVEYDAKGQRTLLARGNGTETRYEYEPDTLRLSRISTSRGGTLLQDIRYVYDPAGNITRARDFARPVVFNNNARVEPLHDYRYDAIYRLEQAAGREHPGLTRDAYRGSRSTGGTLKQSRFLPATDTGDLTGLEPYVRVYEYDDGGNLTAMRHRAANSARSFTRRILISSRSNRGIPEEQAGGGEPDDFFDGAGQIRELEHLDSLEWNFQKRIARVGIMKRADGQSDGEYYVYDGAGMRLRRVTERYGQGGGVLEVEEKITIGKSEFKRIRQIREDGESLLLERASLRLRDDDNNLAVIHAWLENAGRRELPAGETRIHYQCENNLDSAALELDGDGRIISYEEFFPFGGTAFIAGRSETEVKLKEYRYAGKERDDATGLYYYGARYYAPWLGRWLSPDPAGALDGPNLYVFVLNNPIRYTDQGGLCIKAFFRAIGNFFASICPRCCGCCGSRGPALRDDEERAADYGSLADGGGDEEQGGSRAGIPEEEVKVKEPADDFDSFDVDFDDPEIQEQLAASSALQRQPAPLRVEFARRDLVRRHAGRGGTLPIKMGEYTITGPGGPSIYSQSYAICMGVCAVNTVTGRSGLAHIDITPAASLFGKPRALSRYYANAILTLLRDVADGGDPGAVQFVVFAAQPSSDKVMAAMDMGVEAARQGFQLMDDLRSETGTRKRGELYVGTALFVPGENLLILHNERDSGQKQAGSVLQQAHERLWQEPKFSARGDKTTIKGDIRNPY